jgi:hypothetical protein
MRGAILALPPVPLGCAHGHIYRFISCKLRVDQSRNRGSFLIKAKVSFSSPNASVSALGPNPAATSLGSAIKQPGGEANHPLSVVSVVRVRDTVPPLEQIPSWRSQGGLYFYTACCE